MRFIAPRTGAVERTIAEDQPEYSPITICEYQDSALGSSILLSRITFTAEERSRIAAGEDIFIGQLTFGQPFTPLQITVGMAYWKVNVP